VWTSHERNVQLLLPTGHAGDNSLLPNVPSRKGGTIGGGSIYKVGGPDAERRRCQRDGEGMRGGVRNVYQLFILFTLKDILTNLCFQVRQNVTDKNYGLGLCDR